ncbi:unnamed protein product [Musa banksii]
MIAFFYLGWRSQEGGLSHGRRNRQQRRAGKTTKTTPSRRTAYRFHPSFRRRPPFPSSRVRWQPEGGLVTFPGSLCVSLLLRSRRCLRHRGELLEVEADDGVGEQLCVVHGVPLRHVHHVRLENHRPGLPALPRGELVDGGNGPVVPEAVLSADDGEAEHTPAVVDEVEALGAGARREAGYDADLAEAPRSELATAVTPVLEGAAPDEVLVDLGTVEPPDHRPDGGGRGPDPLGEDGGALSRADVVPMVGFDRGAQARILLRRQTRRSPSFCCRRSGRNSFAGLHGGIFLVVWLDGSKEAGEGSGT